MLESLSVFYNNLFVVEITAFGIIAAVILVFMQLFHSQFSYKHISIIFRSTYFISVFSMSVITITGTGLASVLSALPSHNFVQKINFHIREILSNNYAPFVLFILFFLSMILFLTWIVINLKYLKPENVLLLVAKRIKRKNVAEFILMKYGVTAPQPKLKINENMNHQQISIQIQTEDVNYEIKKRYDQIMKKVANATDPFEMLVPIVVTGLKNSNLTTIDNFCNILVKISDSFIGSLDKTDKKTEDWDPYSDLTTKYLQYIIDYIQTFLNLSEKHQFVIAKTKFLQVTRQIGEMTIRQNEHDEMKVLFNFWKNTGEISIVQNIFNDVVKNYRAIADYLFENNLIEGNEILSDIFKDLGWLGKCLLGKSEFEDKPLVWDDRDVISNFDVLFDTLLSYGDKYSNRYPKSYPLIFFDAIYGVFDKLLILYKNHQKIRLKESIFNCVFVYYSFGKASVSVQNEDGAALATMKLKQSYSETLEHKVFGIGEEIVDLFIRLGGCAADSDGKMGVKSFLYQPLEDYIIDCLSDKIPDFDYQKELEGGVVDVILPGQGNYDARWNFIKKLGKTLQTNFGLNFDWHTGKSLTENQ